MSNVTPIKPPERIPTRDIDAAETAILQARAIVDVVACTAGDNVSLADGSLLHSMNVVLDLLDKAHASISPPQKTADDEDES